MADFKRSTAKICSINELINGKFIKKEGWDPSYIITPYGKIFRTNLLGVIVSKNINDCVLDDGTGKIIVRSFNKEITAEIGDPVLVIGKPRVFNNETFVNSEIIRKIENTGWIAFRKRELVLRQKEEVIEEVKEYVHESKEQVITEEHYNNEKNKSLKKLSNTEKVIKIINELDSGDGANIEDLISKLGITDVDRLIKNLTEEGEIFQIKPGKLKVM